MEPAPPSLRARLANAAATGLTALRGWAGAPDMAAGPHLNAELVAAHNQRNRQQTTVLVGAMALLLMCAATLLAGWFGLALAAVSLTGVIALGTHAAPETVMQTYGGERVDEQGGQTLLALTRELARRAELPRVPDLYVIRSSLPNAFAVGTPARAAIAVTEGLVRRLQMRELAGVLAHEMSHIRSGDLGIMGLADGITRMARLLSFLAVVLLILNLLDIASFSGAMSWFGLILLYLMPMVSGLMQQALSRTREFDADLDGVTLTGDAEGLASALHKLDKLQGRPWEDLVYGTRRVPQPSVLRSHPTTADRIARLQALSVRGTRWPRLVVTDAPVSTRSTSIGTAAMRPRFRWLTGVWY